MQIEIKSNFKINELEMMFNSSKVQSVYCLYCKIIECFPYTSDIIFTSDEIQALDLNK